MELVLSDWQKKRSAHVRDMRIWMEIHNLIFSDMEECKELAKYGGEPPCMLCYGDTGSGKSAQIEKFRNDHKRYEKADRSVIPVVYSVLPTKLSERGLLIKLLKAIGQEIEDYKELDEDDLLQLIVKYVDQLGIELFIIDEAQGFLEHESRRLVYDATECLKRLIIETKRPFILFGMPWCLYAIEQNSQLASRFLRRRYLSPFIISELSKKAVYLNFLDELDERLGFEEKADLKSREISLRLFVVSRGNLRVLRNVIDQAAFLAIKENARQITYDHFLKACEAFFPGDENPFRMQNLDKLEFFELEKPSYWDQNAKRGVNPVVEQTFTEVKTLSEIV
ncbi:TniB family NTP-binding protein [Endozoicomonas gorgoniicola]|uniref:TniB family NTP-binding protein n=1 Tax=Endozoicomonas gorgoniicola TaxID=1234144 RepID=A0ABT3N2Q3_9GAMM|nr:TniB family NTP-binding protein [Endozoicomonas gorgoniicola]MCW7555901.1 TniB family NTP-binding protein [Endozoicomonas gorgoniicola]